MSTASRTCHLLLSQQHLEPGPGKIQIQNCIRSLTCSWWLRQILHLWQQVIFACKARTKIRPEHCFAKPAAACNEIPEAESVASI